MKKTRFIQLGVVTLVFIGILLTNIDSAFALTGDIRQFFSDTSIADNTENSDTFANTDSSETFETEPEVPSEAVTEPEIPSEAVTESEIPSEAVTEPEIPSDTETSESEDSTGSESSDLPVLDTEESMNPESEQSADTDNISPDNPSSDNTEDSLTDSAPANSESAPSDASKNQNDSVLEDANINESNNTEDKDTETSEADDHKDSDSQDDVLDESRQEDTISDNISDNTAAETGSTTNSPTKSEANISHQETKSVTGQTTIQKDNSKNAVYIQPAYTPLELFIDIEDRIKYNTALPIDNIPSFITQEMIVGALKCQDETGYPASVTIAQIILESGFGKYGPGGDDHQGLSYLAYEYCNLFGIKGIGTAGSVDMRTGEQNSSGEYYTITAGFRVYNTYTECIEDRTDLLKKVYSDLTEGVTDANTFATRIGSRWATNLQYSQNLITLMQRYDLYRLDRMTLKNFSDMIGKFADPCPGSYLTSSFGYRTFDNSFHKGIDLGTNGSPIPTYAAEAGTVIIAGYNVSAGNWIVIDHGNGLVTKYMHHSHIFVNVGDKVEKGQQIGLTGNTGKSSGVHLHFQVEENGVAVDPTIYLNSYTE